MTDAVLQLGAAVGSAIVGAIYSPLLNTDNVADAAASTLWYNAAVLIPAVLLTPFLPRAARPPEGVAAVPSPALTGEPQHTATSWSARCRVGLLAAHKTAREETASPGC